MSPTSKKTSEVTNTGLQICCTSCCIREKMLHNEEGKVNRGVVLEDMVVLGTDRAICEGSSPFRPTINIL